ncbi:hypothetical protein LIP_2906 [Limnochorda pilosa]|uniref:Uncharacterized protein n=1 Tax=Limnochorda pilosa TaxID=1555112 RepID=A0A0K2SNQ1_LIMPI|nr:hypothetical protein LIP_2906 [Limnochorda pilosa]
MEVEARALRERIDAVEAAYEFMLAYAGLGLPASGQSGRGGEVVHHLRRVEAALEGLPDLLAFLAQAGALGPTEPAGDLVDATARDARTTQAVVRLVLALPVISSKMVDSVNALTHVRALLTDLFVLDELLVSAASGSGS